MIIEEIKDKIYPWIKVVYGPDETVPDSQHEIDLDDEDRPIAKSWLGNLSIFYAVDNGDSFSLIQTRDLTVSSPETWAID